MLEGNEIEKSYDDGAGKVIVDVTDKGSVKVSNEYVKDLGYAKIKSVTELESSIFVIAEKIAAKTKTPWDDSAIKALEKILGIETAAAPEAAAEAPAAEPSAS